jgi:hypothetical protein
MQTAFSRTINGFHIHGLAEVEPGEPATDISPAWPTIVTVYELYIDGSDKNCIEIINPAVIQQIEHMIAEEA